MTTFSDLIETARNELMTSEPERINRISGAVDASTESVTLTLAAQGISAGSRLSVGLEIMHVIGVSGQVVNVIRGFGGSTASAHSDGDLVYVAPQFPAFLIAQKINDGLNDLQTRGLFQVKTFEFDYIPVRSGFDFDVEDLIDIYSVHYDVPGPTRLWPRLNRRDYYVDQSANTTDFPSGNQLVLRQGGYPGHKVRVAYKAKFAPLVALSDDVEAVAGLHAGAHDLPPLFAAYRLNAGREVKRSFLNRQPEPRRAEEVPPGSAELGMTVLQERYLEGVTRELGYLMRRYPEQL